MVVYSTALERFPANVSIRGYISWREIKAGSDAASDDAAYALQYLDVPSRESNPQEANLSAGQISET